MSGNTTLETGRTPAAPRSRAAGWLAAALLLGSPCLVAGAFFQPFLRYDDEKIIAQNPLAEQGFTAAALEQIARPPWGDFRGYYAQYIPLTHLGLGAQYRLVGPRAWTFRLGNLLFHLASAWLLFRILVALGKARASGARDLPGSPRAADSAQLQSTSAPPFLTGEGGPAAASHLPEAAAAFGAALFFFHPTNVESVAWAAERNNTQGLSFCLLAWWLLLARARPGWGLLAFAAGLLSKPAAVGFAPLLILSELLLTRDSRKQRLAWSVAYALPAAVTALLALRIAPYNLLPVTGGGYGASLLTSLSVVGRALAHLFVPWDLSFFYAIAPVNGLGDPSLILAVVLLPALWLLLRWLRVETRPLAVLFCGGLLTLAPILSPRTISFLYQDRYLYFALPPALALLILAWAALKRRAQEFAVWERRRGACHWQRPRPPSPVPAEPSPPTRSRRLPLWDGAALGVAACVLLALLSFQRSRDFRDLETLCADAARKQPGSFFAHFLLAEKLLLNSLEPQTSPAERHAILEQARAWMDRAHQAADQDRHQDPGKVHEVEGEILWRLGWHQAARDHLLAALEQDPPSPLPVRAQAQWILAEISKEEYLATHDPYLAEEAVLRLLWYLKSYPDAAHAWNCLAEVLERRGDRSAARAAYTRAAKDPFFAPYAEAALKRLGEPGTQRQGEQR